MRTHLKVIAILLLLVSAIAVGQGFIEELDVGNIKLNGNTISTTNTNGHLVITPDGTGLLEYTPGTASTVPYFDANKRLTSSAVTPTELGLLSGVSGTLVTESSTSTFTNKSLDGDDNIFSDISISSLKTVLANASKFLSFDSSGAPVATKDVPTGDVVGTSDAQTLSSKTLSSPILDVIVAEGLTATPSTPASGFVKIYAKSDDKVYKLDSNGFESELGSGGSGGNIVLPAPTVQRFTSGSGTYNKMYAFVIGVGSVTAGDTYENNTITFTAYKTVSNGTLVYMSGSGAPTSTGTLTKLSGSGDDELTFSEVKEPSYLRVRMVGGGAGGNGSGSSNSGGRGAAGGDTTFGSNLLTAGGAPQPAAPTGGTQAGGAGGTPTIASADNIFILAEYTGSYGQSGQQGSTATQSFVGGMGGYSPFGGAGRSVNTGAGIAAITNTGSGGGGAGTSSTAGIGSGAGGGAGAYIEVLIHNPDDTYPYEIGTGGNGGSAGTSGFAGGNGASGIIIVEEHFQ